MTEGNAVFKIRKSFRNGILFREECDSPLLINTASLPQVVYL